MSLTISLVIIFITLTHSLFGAGILTFGVPILLVLGIGFQYISDILVPLSFMMSGIILWQDRKYLFFNQYCKNLFIFSLPVLVLFIFLNLHVLNLNILKSVMALVLILFGLGRWYHPLQNVIFKIIRKVNILSFMLMGALHGYANMGGSIMIPLVTMDFHDKIKIRLYNSLSFTLFTLIQMVLSLANKSHHFPNEVLYYLPLGFFTHYFLGNKIHQKVNATLFYHLLTILMITNGLFLAYQALPLLF